MNQKGFSQLILVIIVGAIVVVAGGGFYYQKSTKQNKSAMETQVVQELPATPAEQPKPQITEVSKPADKPVVPKETAPIVIKQPPVSSPAPATAPSAPAPAPIAATCDLTPRPRQFSNTPYYTGSLFDAHIHMPGPPEIKKLSCTFDKEKTKGAIGFYWSQSQSLEKMLAETKSIKNDSSGKIRLVLMPKPYSLKNLEDIEITHKGLFTGYGEMAFYNRGDPSQSYYPQSPDEQQFLDLYALAGKNNFVVMIHPNQGQQQAVENVLQKILM